MDYYFMNDLLNCNDDELRKISDRIAEQLETRRKLKRKEAFDNFMCALEVMARNYPDELFDIDEYDGGKCITMDWEELYRNFLE